MVCENTEALVRPFSALWGKRRLVHRWKLRRTVWHAGPSADLESLSNQVFVRVSAVDRSFGTLFLPIVPYWCACHNYQNHT